MLKGKITRRNFVSTLSVAAAGSVMPTVFLNARETQKTETIQNVIDMLIAAATREPFEGTVDTIKSGDPGQKVRGIVTTFMANAEVIKKAIASGANFIVTHEPTFYNHRDETGWLTDNEVFQYKKKMLEDNGIVVFRFHDYLHSIKPDPVRAMTVKKLGWEDYAETAHDNVYAIPPTNLSALIQRVKEKLGSRKVRIVGDPQMKCERVGILVGAPGGRRQISFMSETGVDVLVAGEIAEWETSEYVRDAISAGKNRALLIAGHADTEEHGMEWLAGWLRDRLPDVPVSHIPGQGPFKYF